MRTLLLTTTHLAASLLVPLSAQNFATPLKPVSEDGDRSSEVSNALPISGIPVIARVEGNPAEDFPMLGRQDGQTLEPRVSAKRSADSNADLSVLEKPSPFRKLAVGGKQDSTAIAAGSLKQDLAKVSAAYRESGKPDSNCQGITLSIEHRIMRDAANVLEIVEAEVRANPSCACEIVKTAIKVSEADSEKVVSIVEASINAAPETMRIVSQCAIAAMPESLAGVQALLAKYDANGGEGRSAKSSKDTKDAKSSTPGQVAAMPNPLDFPGGGPVGPTPGGPGGQPLIPNMPPIIITPPTVTRVDP